MNPPKNIILNPITLEPPNFFDNQHSWALMFFNSNSDLGTAHPQLVWPTYCYQVVGRMCITNVLCDDSLSEILSYGDNILICYYLPLPGISTILQIIGTSRDTILRSSVWIMNTVINPIHSLYPPQNFEVWHSTLKLPIIH